MPSGVRSRRIHSGALRLRRLLLIHIYAIVLILLLLSLARAAAAATCYSLVVHDERVAQAILLQADAIVLGEGAAMVNLMSVLRQGVVLELLEFVAGGHVAELLAAMVIQDCA